MMVSRRAYQILFVVLSFFCIAEAPSVKAADEDVLAKVGQHVLTRKDFDDLVKVGIEQGLTRENILQNYEEFIRSNFIVQKLLQDDIDELEITKSRQFRDALERQTEQLKIQFYTRLVAGDQINQETIQKEYESFKNLPEIRLEFNVRHILLESEEEAVSVRKRLEDGEDFSGLAKEYSLDPGTSLKGGELGFITAHSTVRPFAVAVLRLEDDETTKEPVKTQYGYHIIQRLGSRPSQSIPSFEQSQELLQTRMIERIVDSRLNKKLEEAKYEIAPYTE